MGKLRALLDTLNSLTGISIRRNRALRDVKDWAKTMQRFLSTYDLCGSPGFNSLSKNIGEAKSDLTAISYRARLLIKTVKNIKGKQVLPLIVELTDSFENLRRVLVNPSLQDIKLSKVIPNLLNPSYDSSILTHTMA